MDAVPGGQFSRVVTSLHDHLPFSIRFLSMKSNGFI